MLHLLASVWSAATDIPETRLLILGRSNHGKTALFERFKILLKDPSTSAKSQREKQQQKEKDSASKIDPVEQVSLDGLAALKAHAEKMQSELQNQAAALDSSHINADADADAEQQQQQPQKCIEFTTPLPRFMTPTVGLNVGRGECVITNDSHSATVNSLLWDVGGDPEIRALWETYLIQAHGVVFVVDLTADEHEMVETVRLLHQLMLRPELAFAPFLVVGTKFDQIVALERRRVVREEAAGGGDRVAAAAAAAAAAATTPPTLNENLFIRSTIAKLMSQLHLDDVALAAMMNLEHHGHHHSKNGSKKTTTTKEQKQKKKKKSSNNVVDDSDSSFDDVDDNLLIALEVGDVMHSVPQGSGVSGIAGHMFHCIVASSVTIDGNDLLTEGLQWILSVSSQSKARQTALEALANAGLP